jgi:hypothetical protein
VAEDFGSWSNDRLLVCQGGKWRQIEECGYNVNCEFFREAVRWWWWVLTWCRLGLPGSALCDLEEWMK